MPTTQEYLDACIAAQAKADPALQDSAEAQRFVMYYEACKAIEPPASTASQSALVLVEVVPQNEDQAQKLEVLKADSLKAVQAAVCPAPA